MIVYNNLECLPEIILLERFYESLSDDLRVWLVDNDPQTLAEAAKLADTYTVNHHNYTTRTENEHYNNNSQTALPLEVRITHQANASHQNKFLISLGKININRERQKTSDILPPIIYLFVASVIKQTI